MKMMGISRAPVPLFDELSGLESVEPGHLHVEQDEREVPTEQVAKCFLARAALDQLVAKRIEHRFDRNEVRRMIVHDQDGGT